mgnify:CR=1 FL=1
MRFSSPLFAGLVLTCLLLSRWSQAAFPTVALKPVCLKQIHAPTTIAFAPDGSGRLFVCDQPGRILILQGGMLLPTPFLDITSLAQALEWTVNTNANNDNGALQNSQVNNLVTINAPGITKIRGIEADIGKEHADTFRNVQHPDLRADYVLANPPFNDSDWFRKEDDVRWQFGVPPNGNANFAWVQHFIHHLAPQGMAGFVLANGSMSSNQSGEGDIRRALIEADLVDCMVALPGQLFYSTQIPVCLWFLAKNKNADAKRGFRDRRKQTLFIDARKLGTLIDRVHRELTDADLEKISSTYHLWRGDPHPASGRPLPQGARMRWSFDVECAPPPPRWGRIAALAAKRPSRAEERGSAHLPGRVRHSPHKDWRITPLTL